MGKKDRKAVERARPSPGEKGSTEGGIYKGPLMKRPSYFYRGFEANRSMLVEAGGKGRSTFQSQSLEKRPKKNQLREDGPPEKRYIPRAPARRPILFGKKKTTNGEPSRTV